MNDEKFHKQVVKKLKKEHNTLVHEGVDELLKWSEIHQDTANNLKNNSPRTAALYLLPKIHKNKILPPGRPIISENECPTQRTSQFVDFFLQLHLLKIKSYIRDTTDFLIKLIEFEIPDGRYILFTLDVTSLYTNIPQIEGVLAVLYFLEKHHPHGVTPFNPSIPDLLELILKLNNFEFNGEHYLQIGGTAMGTKVAPSLANIFMGDFEEKHVYWQG